MAELFLLCVLGGSLVGLLSGMLGMGGAFIIIPLLDTVLPRFGLTPDIAHLMAVGTSPSTILFTCIASFLAHRRLGSMRGDLLRRMAPGIFIGSVSGAFLAPHMPTGFLKILFAAIVLIVSLHIWFPLQRRNAENGEDLRYLEGVALFFGMLASMSGVAGTMLNIAWLNSRGVSWDKAVGTGAGIGLIIALTATFGYICSGWNVPNLPAWSLGYVYLPGTLCLVLPSMLMAEVGARIVHWKALPLNAMKKFMGIVLIILSLNIIWSVIADFL